MCFISISVRVFLVVILVTSRGTSLAEGTVVCREVVHSITLSTEEVAVQVVKVLTNYGVIHPHHKYPIEAGGFTAWPTGQCKRQPCRFMTRSVCCCGSSCRGVVYSQDSDSQETTQLTQTENFMQTCSIITSITHIMHIDLQAKKIV